MITQPDTHGVLLELTADIVTAHLRGNTVAASDVPALVGKVHAALARQGPRQGTANREEPAVPVRSSVKPDYLVCLEDGKKMKLLKRYLMTNYGMTPEDYRRKWDLPADYPMVAPNYARRRSELAKALGLGKKRQSRGGA